MTVESWDQPVWGNLSFVPHLPSLNSQWLSSGPSWQEDFRCNNRRFIFPVSFWIQSKSCQAELSKRCRKEVSQLLNESWVPVNGNWEVAEGLWRPLGLWGQYRLVIRAQTLDLRPRFKSCLCPSLVVWPWAGHLVAWSPYFLIWTIGRSISTPSSQDSWEESMEEIHIHLSGALCHVWHIRNHKGDCCKNREIEFK